MKQIYTNENRLLAMNSKNTLENAGIGVVIKNEHTAGSSVPGHQIWLELWVNDSDYERAVELLKLPEMMSSTIGFVLNAAKKIQKRLKFAGIVKVKSHQ